MGSIIYNIVDGGKLDFSFEKDFDLVAKKLCLKYDYYDLLRYSKCNNWDEFMMLGSTKFIKWFDEKKIRSALETILKESVDVGGFVMLSCSCPIIVINDFLLNIGVIIHEINHLITKEKLVNLCDDEMNVVGDVEYFGINSGGSEGNDDFIDEIINELMTIDILNNLNYENMLNRKRENSDITFGEYMASNGDSSRGEAEMIKANVTKSYSDYLEYYLSLDKYVDNLVSIGKARKVK